MEDISKLEKTQTIVDVTLHKNSLTDNESYFGIINKSKATFNNILAEIAKKNKGVDPHLIQYAGILIQKEILKMLEQGKAVNLLDLGTISAGLKCNATDKDEAKAKSNIVIKFSPTQIAREAISSIKVNEFNYHNPNPEINRIIDLTTNQDISELMIDKPIKFIGKKVKLGGNKYGIYFIEVDENEKMLKKENEWIKVDESKIFRNTPTELNFFIPTTLSPNTYYKILINTSYLKNGKSRKKTIYTYSKIIKTQSN